MQLVLVISSQVVVTMVIMEAVDGMFLLLVYISVRSIQPVLIVCFVLDYLRIRYPGSPH